MTVILILAQYGAGKRIERKETESVSKPWLIQNAIDMIHVLRKEKIKFHWNNLPKSKSSNAFFSTGEPLIFQWYVSSKSIGRLRNIGRLRPGGQTY